MKARCNECNVTLSITETISGKCRCSEVFCKKHRLNHLCSYDHQAVQRNALQQLNPTIKPDKVNSV